MGYDVDCRFGTRLKLIGKTRLKEVFQFDRNINGIILILSYLV